MTYEAGCVIFAICSVAGFLLMAVFSLLCGNAWAQTTGTLLGIVSDQNGAVIPSASVRVTNTDTGFTANTVSNFGRILSGSIAANRPLLDFGYSKRIQVVHSSPTCRFQSPKIFVWM